MATNYDDTVTPGMSKVFEMINKALHVTGWWDPPDNFKGRDDDIFITTFMKSGTTWTQQICHQIRTGGTEDFENIGDEVIMLRPMKYQHLPDFDERASRYHPRCWKSHMLPDQVMALGGKHIFVVRNPIDVCMSMYHFIPPNLGIKLEDLPFPDYYFGYFATLVDPKPYWTVLLDWLKHKDDPNVMIIFFEDLKKDLSTMVDKIAAFMGCTMTPEHKAKVLEYSEFNYMRERVHKFTDRGELDNIAGTAAKSLDKDAKIDVVGKVRTGQTGNKVPDVVAEHIRCMWKVHLLPVTHTNSYEEFLGKFSALKSLQ